MTVIAVVDDRADMRESVAERIKLGLEDMKLDWDVIADEPLESIEEYPAWIADNEVCVLVLDEKLGEEIGRRGVATTYSGHEVAATLREQLPELPQLIITSIKNSDELEGAAELDAIVQRDEFDKHWRVYVERMVRLATRFVNRNEAELAELTELSQKVVDRTATPGEISRLNAIRETVQMRVNGSEVVMLRHVLTEAEAVKDRLQRVIERLKTKS
jgi:hypothetical protein